MDFQIDDYSKDSRDREGVCDHHSSRCLYNVLKNNHDDSVMDSLRTLVSLIIHMDMRINGLNYISTWQATCKVRNHQHGQNIGIESLCPTIACLVL